MKPTPYQHSFLNKISILFFGKTLSNIIQISDEDKELVDNVRFFEVNFNDVVGFYMNGSNPLTSKSHVGDFDDFNLYALYSVINEHKYGSFSSFRIDHIKVFFHPEYNEVVSVFLSSSDLRSSVFIIFSTDQIYTSLNCSPASLTDMIKSKLTQFDGVEFLTFQASMSDDQCRSALCP